ncbi:MAG: DUF4011 domain-containing protein [Planctomycetia bacterium]|nr:DUF4011 domain-containing protein [Planctomycetia bacterium]
MSTTSSGKTSILNHIDNWRTKLLDLTKRNPLVSLKVEGRGTTIVITQPQPEELWSWLSDRRGTLTFRWREDSSTGKNTPMEEGSRFSSDSDPDGGHPDRRFSEQTRERTSRILQDITCAPGEILTSHTDRELRKRLRLQARRSKESLTEQGIHTLYVAMGTLRWRETPESEQWLTAPLLLFPVSLGRESPGSPWTLSSMDEESQSNRPLTELLRQEYGLELPAPPDFSDETYEEREMDGPSSVDRWRTWLDTIRTALTGHISCGGWTVEEKVVLGLFRFQKLPIWYDLGAHQEQIAEHPICRALCGDSSRMAEFSPDIRELEGEDTDQTIRPESLYTILDCDSSQLRAILAADRGASIVLDGPPGTGKSQTIANIIAQMIAKGKKVLFVSEKKAALDG